jgi:hypothetical protein
MTDLPARVCMSGKAFAARTNGRCRLSLYRMSEIMKKREPPQAAVVRFGLIKLCNSEFEKYLGHCVHQAPFSTIIRLLGTVQTSACEPAIFS